MTRFKVFLAAIAVGLVGCNPSSAQVTKQTTAKAAQPAAKATAQAATRAAPAAKAEPAETKAAAKKGGTVPIDKNLPNYRKSRDEVSGTIKSVGSDTMNNLMALWGEGFKKL